MYKKMQIKVAIRSVYKQQIGNIFKSLIQTSVGKDKE